MRTFCAVVTNGSFAAAARQLNISGALCSKYVSQLEKHLQVRLLNRTTRSNSLTQQGATYFEQCKALLNELDDLEARVRDDHAKPAGQLVVAAPVNIGETFLSQAVAEFMVTYPDISFDIRLSDRFSNVVEEAIDVAVRIGTLNDSSLIARKLAPVHIVLCAAPDYLARSPAINTPHDIKNHDCIIDSNFSGGAVWPFLMKGQRTTITATGRVRVNSASAARHFALKGHGLLLCPRHIVANDIASGHLVQLLNRFNAFESGLYAVYPHHRHLAAKVRVFVDFLAEFVARNEAQIL